MKKTPDIVALFFEMKKERTINPRTTNELRVPSEK